MTIHNLQEAEVLNTFLAAISPIGIYIVQDGKFVPVDTRFEDYLGYSQGELVGVTSLSLVHQEDRARVKENAISMLKGEISAPYQYRFVGKDDSIKWIIETVTSIQYQGRLATLGKFMDITNYKEAQKALEQSEEKYRSLVENVPYIITTIDTYGNVLLINKAARFLLGYEPDEIIGRNLTEFIAEEALPQIKSDLEIINRGTGLTHETIAVRKDGVKRYFEFNSIPRIQGGKYVWTQGILRDVTEHKVAKEALERRNRELSAVNRVAQLMARSINLQDILLSALDGVLELMNIPVGAIYLVDENTGVISCVIHSGFNEEIIQLIYEEPASSTIVNFVSRIVSAGKVVINNNFLERLEPSYREAFERDGFCFAVGIPLKSKGRVLGVIGLCDRISRNLATNETLLLETIGSQIGVAIDNARLFEQVSIQSAAMESYVIQITKAQEEERRRIARELHDETTQSLAALSLKVQEINRDIVRHSKISSKQIMPHLEQLWSEINIMIESVRRFSHELRPEVLDQMGLIATLEMLTDELAGEGNINARLEVAGVEQRLVSEAEVTLFRIAQEALRNIKKHSTATEVTVRIEFGPDKVKLNITDNGKGFKLPNILSTFARKGKLGLIGMNERARLLGGDFTIQSEIGKGTSVSVEVRTE